MGEGRAAVVIEDDADIRGLIGEVLTQAGFLVHTAANGLEGIEAVREAQPVVTTLDVSMPGIDGFETARRIRTISETYLVMVTARTEEIEVLQGLQSGADDYLTKPFRPRELRARIEAMLRRPRAFADPLDALGSSSGSASRAAEPASTSPGEPWLDLRGLRVQPAMRVAEADGARLDLTRSEFDILAELLGAGPRVLTKTDLALAVRGDRYAGDWVSEHDERAIEVHIANLRKKLGDSPSAPRWIETVRGVGYRIRMD